jgi:hypothetical protein
MFSSQIQLNLHKQKYSFWLNAREDRKERQLYVFFECWLYNSQLSKLQEKTKDQLHENFYLSLDQEHQYDGYPKILHLGWS